MTTMNRSVYEIKLGESTHVGPIEFFRVPGGWVCFTIRGLSFVPWNNEFQKENKEKPIMITEGQFNDAWNKSSCGEFYAPGYFKKIKKELGF